MLGLSGTFIWICATLWSAESAIYATVIFYSGLTTAILHSMPNSALKAIAKKLFCYFVLPPLCLLPILALIEIYYLIFLHHAPEWASFFVYGFSYAAGYHDVAISPFGPV